LKDDIRPAETEPNLIKHKKNSCLRITARTGVISSETGQRGFLSRSREKANSIA
jgi:hypothetical protein